MRLSPRLCFYFAAPEFWRKRPRDIGSWHAGRNELSAGLAAGKSRREIATSLGAIVRETQGPLMETSYGVMGRFYV
jgi:hypothetical protein